MFIYIFLCGLPIMASTKYVSLLIHQARSNCPEFASTFVILKCRSKHGVVESLRFPPVARPGRHKRRKRLRQEQRKLGAGSGCYPQSAEPAVSTQEKVSSGTVVLHYQL